jgi:ribosomal protein S12 methylthiotransferase accessory factor
MPKGYGASLSATYALERALLESLQPIHLRNEALSRIEGNTLRRLNRYPILARAAAADINEVYGNENYVVIDFDEVQDLYGGQSLAKQKEVILSLVSERGMNAYHHEVYKTSGYSLVKTMLSGSSPLCFLQVGKLILPNTRVLDKRVSLIGQKA